MTAVEIIQPKVYLKRAMAADIDVLEAMWVSTRGEDAQAAKREGEEGVRGRINWLMKNRHGSPFEQNYFQFFVQAPIAVFREHHRHRIGWSYNEESGRYTKLKPQFYVPPQHRPLVQVGKQGAYEFVPGSTAQYFSMVEVMVQSFTDAYARYEQLLAEGIAKEVARGVLPVYTMTSMVASCNARSMMAFLSLRTAVPEALFPSKPMWEIDRLVARVYEEALATHMPITHRAFCDNGRVAP